MNYGPSIGIGQIVQFVFPGGPKNLIELFPIPSTTKRGPGLN